MKKFVDERRRQDIRQTHSKESLVKIHQEQMDVLISEMTKVCLPLVLPQGGHECFDPSYSDWDQ